MISKDKTNISKESDFIMVLSSEMISDIVQRYLNEEMYKKQVEVVDTKPTDSGYAFGICFVQTQKMPETERVDLPIGLESKDSYHPQHIQSKGDPFVAIMNNKIKRNNKGKFTTHKE